MIYVIGNSHVNFFTNAHPGTELFKTDQFVSYNFFACTAYKFWEKHFFEMLNVFDMLKVKRDTDYILMVAGEVDCRVHIPKQADIQGISDEEAVRLCLEKFFPCLMDLKARGFRPIGWGSHPSANLPPSDVEDMPIYGDVYRRNRIGKMWGEQLKSLCDRYDIPFVSIFDDLLNEDGTTKTEYFMDYCHLNDAMWPKVSNIFLERFPQ